MGTLTNSEDPGEMPHNYYIIHDRPGYIVDLCLKNPSLILLIDLELAIDPLPPRGYFVHYNFLKLRYLRHKMKENIPLRVAALTCNITLYTLPPPPPPPQKKKKKKK